MDDELTIAAVGDISLGDHYLCCGFGVHTKTARLGADYFFEHVRTLLRDNDVIFGNLEGVLSSVNFNKHSLKSRQMRGLPESVVALKNAGFNILSLANNHIMQHGKKALMETIDRLEEHNINYCGVKVENKEHDGAFFVENKGVSTCFLSYNDRPEKYLLDKPIYKKFKINNVIKDIDKYKEQADLIIISVHWGDEYLQIPSLEQQEVAHMLVDQGVDVILGHHPHVVQGVEKYKDSLIFYSLGNFVFDMPWNNEANQSIIAKIRFNKLQKKLTYDIIPIKINNNFQPEPMSNIESIKFLKFMQSLSNSIIENRKKYGPHNYKRYYLEKLLNVSKIERKLSHQFWRSNCFRYPSIFLIQYIYEILTRRWHYIKNKVMKRL